MQALLLVVQHQLGTGEDGWVPLAALEEVARYLARPLVEVYDVALLRAGSLGSHPTTPRNEPAPVAVAMPVGQPQPFMVQAPAGIWVAGVRPTIGSGHAPAPAA